MTILVLEDEPIVTAAVRHILKQYLLLEANSAEEALGIFNARGHEIDLLLADVTLPTRSGTEVAVILRQHRPKLPVILMSGSSEDCWTELDAMNLRNLGQSSVTILLKPFWAQTLQRAVRDLVEGHRVAEAMRSA
jgi:CheY-like chemotaxis protein